MFMRNVRNEIENHSDGCIFLKIRLKIILLDTNLRKIIENRLEGYIFWDWATSTWANILKNKIENNPNVYIYREIELKIILMAIFSETRNWKSCRWIYFLWGPKWSELLLWEGGEPWWGDPVSSARQLPTQPTFVLGAEYFLPGLYTRLSTNYEQNKFLLWTKSSLLSFWTVKFIHCWFHPFHKEVLFQKWLNVCTCSNHFSHKRIFTLMLPF